MKKITNSLGKKDNFQAGDLVCWTDLAKRRRNIPGNGEVGEQKGDHRMIGVVSDVFFEHVGGRDVVLANVFCLKDEKKYEIPLISLKRIDKNKTIYDKEGKNDGICCS
jgi:hypothetical protein